MKWTLKNKILTGFFLTLAINLILLLASISGLLIMGNASNNILKNNYKSIEAANAMALALANQDNALSQIISGSEEIGFKNFFIGQTAFLQWLAKEKEVITEIGEDTVVLQLESAYTEYLISIEKNKKVLQLGSQSARAYYNQIIVPKEKTLQDLCTKIKDLNQIAMFEANTKAHKTTVLSIWAIILLGIFAAIVGVKFSFTAANRIVEPVRLMLAATEQITKGNFEIELPQIKNDELGQLIKEFNFMASKLKGYNEAYIKRIMEEKNINEAIIRNIGDGIIISDDEYRINNINIQAAKSLGVEPEDVIGSHILEVINNEFLLQNIKLCFETKKAPLVPEDKNTLLIEKEGKRTYFQFFINPIFTTKNQLSGVLTLLRDITKLKEIDELKSEFVMIVSHELKTPLTSIRMSMGLLKESAGKLLSSDDLELFEIVNEEVERLRSLITDLLDLSKIEAGKMEMDFASVELHDLAENIMDTFRAQAQDKEINLLNKLSKDFPPVKADVNKLTLVITNLFSNAVRYVDKAGTIQISAEDMGKFAYITVKDNGAGIPLEYQQKIFDKFLQVKDKRNSGGTGLGLAICREIIRSHGGTIWVESTPGQGTTFTFSVPFFNK